MEIITYGKQHTKYNAFLEKKRENTCSLSRTEDVQKIHTHFGAIYSQKPVNIVFSCMGHVSITSSAVFAVLSQKTATTQLELVTLNACSTYIVYCPYTCRCCWYLEVSSCSVTVAGLIHLSYVLQSGAIHCLSQHRSLGELQSLG